MGRGLYFCLDSGVLPCTYSVSNHCTHSTYVTGTFPAISLVVNPTVVGFTYVLRPCRPVKGSVLKIWQFLPLPQPRLVFTARSYGDLSFWCWNPVLCSLAWGRGHSLPRHPPQFLSTTHECGTSHSASTSPQHTESPHLTVRLHDPLLLSV